jgi:hypothetical protein
MADEAGDDTRRVVRANHGQRQRAAYYCCHKEDHFISGGHGFLRQISRHHGDAGHGLKWRREGSPNSEIAMMEN